MVNYACGFNKSEKGKYFEWIIIYYVILCRAMPQHWTAMHCTKLHYTTLHYTTLHYTALDYYTVLVYSTQVNSTFRAPWLGSRGPRRLGKYYSPPSSQRKTKWQQSLKWQFLMVSYLISPTSYSKAKTQYAMPCLRAQVYIARRANLFCPTICRHIVTNKVTIWSSSYSACVVYTKTIIYRAATALHSTLYNNTLHWLRNAAVHSTLLNASCTWNIKISIV